MAESEITQDAVDRTAARLKELFETLAADEKAVLGIVLQRAAVDGSEEVVGFAADTRKWTAIQGSQLSFAGLLAIVPLASRVGDVTGDGVSDVIVGSSGG